MKDGTAGVVIEESAGLNPKMNSYLVDDNSEHKKKRRCEWKYCWNNKS